MAPPLWSSDEEGNYARIPSRNYMRNDLDSPEANQGSRTRSKKKHAQWSTLEPEYIPIPPRNYTGNDRDSREANQRSRTRSKKKPGQWSTVLPAYIPIPPRNYTGNDWDSQEANQRTSTKSKKIDTPWSSDEERGYAGIPASNYVGNDWDGREANHRSSTKSKKVLARWSNEEGVFIAIPAYNYAGNDWDSREANCHMSSTKSKKTSSRLLLMPTRADAGSEVRGRSHNGRHTPAVPDSYLVVPQPRPRASSAGNLTQQLTISANDPPLARRHGRRRTHYGYCSSSSSTPCSSRSRSPHHRRSRSRSRSRRPLDEKDLPYKVIRDLDYIRELRQDNEEKERMEVDKLKKILGDEEIISNKTEKMDLQRFITTQVVTTITTWQL